MKTESLDFALPFVTAADPATGGEGAIDPLGFAQVADRLAEWVLPGMTSRMERPRFVTAMAVSAAVCEGLVDRGAGDGMTPAEVVFEWLLVEGFARRAGRDEVRRTPGIDKAASAVAAGMALSARGYLKTPSVFGFHGVYKRLARHLGVVDDVLRCDETGYELLKIWEREQGQSGFATGDGSVLRSLRVALDDALSMGHTTRTNGWQGWDFFAAHLAPARIGRREAGLLWKKLLSDRGDRRGEVFELVAAPDTHAAFADGASDLDVIRCLLRRSSAQLAARWQAICAYEAFCGCVEAAFEWLLVLATRSGSQPLSRGEFASEKRVTKLAAQLQKLRQVAMALLAEAPAPIPDLFAQVSEMFELVGDAESLFDAVLQRHAAVQREKPPEGKRQWFERTADDSLLVRPPYRRTEPVTWRRPYRLRAVLSFCNDLRRGRS